MQARCEWLGESLMGQPRSSYEHWKQHSGFAKRLRPNFAAESKFEDVFHQEIRLWIGPFPEVFKVESATYTKGFGEAKDIITFPFGEVDEFPCFGRHTEFLAFTVLLHTLLLLLLCLIFLFACFAGCASLLHCVLTDGDTRSCVCKH